MAYIVSLRCVLRGFAWLYFCQVKFSGFLNRLYKESFGFEWFRLCFLCFSWVSCIFLWIFSFSIEFFGFNGLYCFASLPFTCFAPSWLSFDWILWGYAGNHCALRGFAGLYFCQVEFSGFLNRLYKESLGFEWFRLRFLCFSWAQYIFPGFSTQYPFVQTDFFHDHTGFYFIFTVFCWFYDVRINFSG